MIVPRPITQGGYFSTIVNVHVEISLVRDDTFFCYVFKSVVVLQFLWKIKTRNYVEMIPSISLRFRLLTVTILLSKVSLNDVDAFEMVLLPSVHFPDLLSIKIPEEVCILFTISINKEIKRLK